MREKWHKATAMIVESPDNPPDAVGPTVQQPLRA